MKCTKCKKTKTQPLDQREPWCGWNGKGEHPRFTWKRVRRRGYSCSSCSRDIYLGELYLIDRETKEKLCYDCGMLIVRGVEYLEARK